MLTKIGIDDVRHVAIFPEIYPITHSSPRCYRLRKVLFRFNPCSDQGFYISRQPDITFQSIYENKNYTQLSVHEIIP